MSLFPPFDLELRAPGLTLRLPRDPELERLAARAAARPLLGPEEVGFMGAWTQLASPDLERGILQHAWHGRASLRPQRWSLSFGVFCDGEPDPLGFQTLRATDFAARRSVRSGSWLLPEARGRGIGTLMRVMVLELAFTGLGAREARTAATLDNHASQAVSIRAGYREDGHGFEELALGPTEVVQFVLPAADWRRREAVRISGLGPCLAMLGAGPAPLAPDPEDTLELPLAR